MGIDLNWLQGGCVTVAGHPLSDYCAKMQSYPVFATELDVETFQGRQRSTLFPIKNLITGMRMTARIDFIGSNAERTQAISNFEALFRSQTEPVEIDIGDGFFYKAVMLSSSGTNTEHELITTIEYCWQVTRHKAPISVLLTGENRIWNPGNADKTDCVVEVYTGFYDHSMTGQILWISVNGLEYEMPADAVPDHATVVLDGINKTIKFVNANAIRTVNWTDFPYLIPGWNDINIYYGLPITSFSGRVYFTPTYL